MKNILKTLGARALTATAMALVPQLVAAQTSSMMIDSGAASDVGAIGGSTYNRGAISIANTSNDVIYQTERYGMSGYRIAVSQNGSYQVKLHFAETYSGITAAGQRVFDVNVEGQLLSNFDIFASAGGRNSAVVKSFNVNVQDSYVDIGFVKKVQSPTIQAIEILKVVTTTTPTSTPARVDLMNASNDSLIMQLSAGSVIDLSKVGSNLTFKASVSGSVGSVAFTLDSQASKIENIAPYAYFGDNKGDLNGGSLATGSHVLKVVVYSGTKATGSIISSQSISFSVVSGAISTPAPTATPVPTATPAPTATPVSSSGMNSWIAKNFANVPVKQGNYTTRQYVELPALIKDSTACCAKYGFDVRDKVAPFDNRVAFVNVTITDLKSTDGYGGGFVTGNGVAGTYVYISKMLVDPNWPHWVGYSSTNYDGIVLDGTAATYAEDLTIRRWNADSAMDIKSPVAQFNRLVVEGPGNRSLRFWKAGPHYIANSKLSNSSGKIMWFKDCSTAKVYVYNTTFNGASSISSTQISCEIGSNPQIIYLNEDPTQTGAMHPMFNAQ